MARRPQEGWRAPRHRGRRLPLLRRRQGTGPRRGPAPRPRRIALRLAHLIDPLAEAHRVLALDLLGAGESSKPEDGDYSVAAQARRAKGILDALKVDKATLVGNSYGGGVALVAAQVWPERVERLVLIDSICYAESIPVYVHLCRVPLSEYVAEVLPVRDVARWVLASGKGTLGSIREEELETYLAEVDGPGRRRAIVRTARAVVPRDTKEFGARLKEVKAPALLLWRKEDGTVPVALGRRLAKDLPNATLVELDAGHIPNQQCPERVLEELAAFLKQVRPA